MNRKTVYKSFIIAFLTVATCNLSASVDEALTIWGSKVFVRGFKDSRRVRRYAISALKKYGLFVKTGIPTTRFVYFAHGSTVGLRVKNINMDSILFQEEIKIQYHNKTSIETAIKGLAGKFYQRFPSKGLIYKVRGDEVKINIGYAQGIKKNSRVFAVRFTGTAPAEFDPDYEFDYEKTAEIEITKTGKYASRGKILSDSGVRQFDKIVPVDKNLMASSTEEGKNVGGKSFKLYAGFLSGQLKTISSETYSDEDFEPDEDKKLTFISLVPRAGFEWWWSEKPGLSLDFSYRKIQLNVQDSDPVKASFMLVSADFKYRIKKGKDGKNEVIPSFGYIYYGNTVGVALIRYISIKYHGPQIGIEWRRHYNSTTGFANIRIYPYLAASEDKVYRGVKARGYGLNLDLGCEYVFKNHLGVSGSGFFSWIATSFTGDTSHNISPENQTFSEVYYGLKLLLSFTFPM